MTNERIKEILIDVTECSIDFSVTQTGKESKRVNGFYKPDTHEIFLHNLNCVFCKIVENCQMIFLVKQRLMLMLPMNIN